MKIICPYCSEEQEIADLSRVQHNILCKFCGKLFFAAGELVFRYGKRLDLFRGAKEKKVACPYCGQHFQFSFQPVNDMLGCSECLKVFVLPPAEPVVEVLPSAETIVLPVSQLKKPRSVFDDFAKRRNEAAASSEKPAPPNLMNDPIPIPVPIRRKGLKKP